MIIKAFKNGIFPLVPAGFKGYVDEEEVLKRYCDKINRLPFKKSELPTIQEYFTADDLDKMYIGNVDDLDKFLLDTEKYFDPNLIKKHFFQQVFKKISEFSKYKKDTSYGKIEVALIKNKLKDLKTDIKYMPENEVKNKNLIY